MYIYIYISSVWCESKEGLKKLNKLFSWKHIHIFFFIFGLFALRQLEFKVDPLSDSSVQMRSACTPDLPLLSLKTAILASSVVSLKGDHVTLFVKTPLCHPAAVKSIMFYGWHSHFLLLCCTGMRACAAGIVYVRWPCDPHRCNGFTSSLSAGSSHEAQPPF